MQHFPFEWLEPLRALQAFINIPFQNMGMECASMTEVVIILCSRWKKIKLS